MTNEIMIDGILDAPVTEEEFLNIYIEQKRKENDAKALRVKMEEKLLELYGDMVDDDKSSKQFKVGRYSVKIKRNISYKLSDKGWELIYQMPYDQRPLKYEYNHTAGKNIPRIAMEEIVNETKPSFEIVYK